MKKLLAIAVAVAFAAPAIADTSVYGSARMLLGKQTSAPKTELALSDNASRLGVRGTNAIDNGLNMTHQFEVRGDMVGGGGVNMGYSNVGVKGGFGHVQLGRMDTVLDDVDGGAGFLTNGSFAGQSGDGDNGMAKYTGAFGPVTALAMYRPKGNQAPGATKHQIGLTYKAGPIKVGIGTAKNAAGVSTNSKLRAAVSYSGANYGVGFVHDKADNVAGTKTNTIGGKYSFGKAYIAAAFGKQKGAANKHKSVELGYGLGKGTKVYYQNKSLISGVKNQALGLQHDF